MSSPNESNTEHPLAQNWTKQDDRKQPQNSTVPAPSPATAASSDLDYANSLNYKHQQFARKRRESIIHMAPDINPVQQAKRKLAVKCENVCLTYGEGEHTNYVLNGLSLNVPKGMMLFLSEHFFSSFFVVVVEIHLLNE